MAETTLWVKKTLVIVYGKNRANVSDPVLLKCYIRNMHIVLNDVAFLSNYGFRSNVNRIPQWIRDIGQSTERA